MVQSETSGCVLIVDDDKTNARILMAALKNDYKLGIAGDGQLAVEYARKYIPDIILLDIMMPNMDGYEVCSILKNDPATQNIPIIFVSAVMESASKTKGFGLGAVDYITKPYDIEEVRARVKTQLALKNARESLDRIGRRNKLVLDAVEDGVFGLDEEAKITFANPAVAKITGWNAPELVGMDLHHLLRHFHENGSPCTPDSCLIRRTLQDGTLRSVADEFFAGRGGNPVQVEYSVSPFSDEGTPGVVVSFRDVGERKKAERLRSENERRYREMADEQLRKNHELVEQEKRLQSFILTLTSFVDALVLVDERHKILFINPAAETIIAGARNPETVRSVFASAEQAGPEETDVETRDGNSLFLEIRAMQTEWRGKKARLVAIRDITERKKAEEEARLRQLQLILADRLASIGTLAAGVAHEINNPNGVIMLNAPILAEAWKDAAGILDKHYETDGDFPLGGFAYSKMKDKLPNLCRAVIENSRRIKRIVSELKDFARQDVSDLSMDINPGDVLNSAVSLVSNTIEHATEHFVMIISPLLPSVRGNFQRLEQVVVNLLINACQALPNTSSGIFVRAEFDPETRTVKIRIQDEGAGISAEDIRHIFDPFFTTKRSSGGSGLGLSISKGIIEEHGGKINLESSPGSGTTATIELPCSRAAENGQQFHHIQHTENKE